MSAALDDVATAALWNLRNLPREHIGVIYGDTLERSAPVAGRESTTKGAFTIPAGSLRALFHNHTPSGGAQRFSRDDEMQARRLSVPSYISAGDRVMKYDPHTGKTEEVLAEFPIAEWRAHIMQTILGRDPSDPRGAYR